MAQRRMLAKDIGKSRKLAKVSLKSALLYTWMIPFLDDFGHYEAEADTIKGEVIKYRKDFSERTIAYCLKELDDIGLIKLYEIGGYKYFEQVRFKDYQTFKTDRPRKAEFPFPPWMDSNRKSEDSSGKPDLSKCPTQDEVKLRLRLREEEEEEEEEEEGARGAREGLDTPAAAAIDEFPHIPEPIKAALNKYWVGRYNSQDLQWIGEQLAQGCPEEFMVYAIEQSDEHNARSRAYLRAIVDNGRERNWSTVKKEEKKTSWYENLHWKSAGCDRCAGPGVVVEVDGRWLCKKCYTGREQVGGGLVEEAEKPKIVEAEVLDHAAQKAKKIRERINRKVG